jgi:hypothetical protein
MGQQIARLGIADLGRTGSVTIDEPLALYALPNQGIPVSPI